MNLDVEENNDGYKISLQPGIAFKAILMKAQTMVDGGWRITLDVSQDEAAQILQLVQFRGQILQIAAVPLE